MSDNPGTYAREQANEYSSIFADRIIRFDDGTTMTIPPHPSMRMLDDDVLEEYDAYLEEVETYDRDENGEIKGPPYYKKGRRVSPPREVKIVQIVLGKEQYDLLRSKTINGRKAGARDVWRAWSEQSASLISRSDADPKSDDGVGVLEAVPEGDS